MAKGGVFVETEQKMTLLAVGDIILGEDPHFYMSGIRDVLKAAQIRLGQLEVPYTKWAEVFEGMCREPWRLEALEGCLDIVTLAGNHIYDAKEAGVKDTLDWLDAHQIMHTGGGRNLNEAKAAAVIEKGNVRIGVLNYNCTGPKATYAGETKGGCAYVEIVTAYELGDVANPGGPAENIYSFPKLNSLKKMKADISALKKSCDLVIVYFHKGIVHKPVKLADYEYIVSYAAIDAGADLVFSSHSHILHGIEIYKGKTIYHGLGNGVAWVPSLRADYYEKHPSRKNEIFDPKEWAQKRIERFGFVPDDDYPTYPFHPEAVYTVLARCVIENGQITKTGCVPAIVGKDGVTRVVTKSDGGQDVMEYLKKITEGAGLNAVYQWSADGRVIEISERKN